MPSASSKTINPIFSGERWITQFLLTFSNVCATSTPQKSEAPQKNEESYVLRNSGTFLTLVLNRMERGYGNEGIERKRAQRVVHLANFQEFFSYRKIFTSIIRQSNDFKSIGGPCGNTDNLQNLVLIHKSLDQIPLFSLVSFG